MAQMSEITSGSPGACATPELCQLIDSLIGSLDVPPEATLSDIRAVVTGGDIFLSGEGELLYPQDRTFLVIELDELIDRHGIQAAARDFTGYTGV